MAPWGDSLGQLGRPNIGVGRSDSGQVPVPRDIIYEGWRDGILQQGSLEATPPTAAIDDNTSDIQLSFDGALQPVPGVAQEEDVSPRSAVWIFQHASVDYSTELVIIDPPYLGYKSSGAFAFVNLALAATGVEGWNAVNVAGVLLFSNGTDATYTRDSGAVVVTDISAEVIARTFATVFGRTFAGAYTDPITGLQSLGLRWNAANNDPADWSSSGAEAELLVSNSLEADKIVALRPMGFDALAILCRNSLWIGYPTGDPDRPADPRVRYTGFGCVAEPTAVVTPHGVVYLSDTGVRRYDTNQCDMLSEQINHLILPVDSLNLASYKAVYDPRRDRYLLLTPDGTVWMYEFQSKERPARWIKRICVGLDNLVLFTDQNPNIFWSTILGTWEEQTLSWAEIIQSQQDAPPRLYYVKDSVLGTEDDTVLSFLGTAFTPKWQVPESSREASLEMISTIGFEIEYAQTDGAASQIALWSMDDDGLDLGGTDKAVTIDLPADPLGLQRRTRKGFWVARSAMTGMGTMIGIRINSGAPLIYRIKQKVLDSGPGFNSIQQ